MNLNIDEQALEQAKEELEELKELGTSDRPDTADVVESDDERLDVAAVIASRKQSASTQIVELQAQFVDVLQAAGNSTADITVIDQEITDEIPEQELSIDKQSDGDHSAPNDEPSYGLNDEARNETAFTSHF